MKNSSLFIPDFLKIQRESFRLFLKKGLICELNKRNPIIKTQQGSMVSSKPKTNMENPKSIELRFYSEYYRLSSPLWTPQQALLKKKSYACKVYVPVQLINQQKKQIHLKWIILATLPLMTKRGHFIINGSSRIIINQMARSPGIYFNQNITKSEVGDIKVIYADIIPLRGTWLRLEIDKKRRVWAKMKGTPPIPALVFIQAFQVDISTILQTIEYTTWFQKKREEDLDAVERRKQLEADNQYFQKNFYYQDYFEDERDVPHFIFSENSNIACQTLAKFVYPKAKKSDLSPEIGKDFLERKFMNSRIYDLGLIGRLNLNKRFNQANLVNNITDKSKTTVKQNQTTLNGQDILFAFNELMKIYYGDQIIDDIDDLKNRRLRTAGELIQTQFATGLIRLEKFINEQIHQNCLIEKTSVVRGYDNNPMQSKNTDSFKNIFLKDSFNTTNKNYKITIPHLQKLFNAKPINGALQEFFGLNPLSQFMDQTNPLAEITHKRRLTSLGLGGVERETAGMAIRGIHPTHYGRICPIETPEGQNAGLVNSITTHGYADDCGYLKTPFYKIYKGQIQRELGPLFLSSEQEQQFSVVPGDIFLNSVDILPGKTKINKLQLILGSDKSKPQAAENSVKFFDSESKDSYQIKNLKNYKKKCQIPIRFDREFKRVFRDTVNYMIISPIQMISIATSLIPFLEHDDANRALMGSNMQRQAVSLIYPTRPIVGTGLESRSVSDSGQTGLAPMPGIISYVSSNKVSIYTICSVCSGANVANALIDNDLAVGKCFKSIKVLNSNQFSAFASLQNYHFLMGNYKKKSFLNNTQNFGSDLKNREKTISINLKKFISPRYLNWINNNRTTVEVFKQNEKKSFYNKINKPIRTTMSHFNYFNTTLNRSFRPTPTKGWKKKQRTKNLRCYAFFNGFKCSSFIVLGCIKGSTKLPCFARRMQKSYQGTQERKNNKFFLQNHKKQLNSISINYMNKNKTLFNNRGPLPGPLINKTKLVYRNFINLEKIKKNHELSLNNIPNSFGTKKNKTQINVIRNSDSGNIFKDKVDTNYSNNFVELEKPMKLYDYKLQTFSRSNQDTFLKQSSILTEGNWVQMNDLLADNSTSIGGELALGQNIIVAYLPWEGYNFEDAILISEKLVYEDIYTSLHIERYEIEIRETDFGWEQMTNHIWLNKNKQIPLRTRRQKKIKKTKAPVFLSKEFKNKLLTTFNSSLVMGLKNPMKPYTRFKKNFEIKNYSLLFKQSNNSNRIRFDNYSYLLTHKNIPIQFTGSSNSLQQASDHFVVFNQTDKSKILLPFISSALLTKKENVVTKSPQMISLKSKNTGDKLLKHVQQNKENNLLSGVPKSHEQKKLAKLDQISEYKTKLSYLVQKMRSLNTHYTENMRLENENLFFTFRGNNTRIESNALSYSPTEGEDDITYLDDNGLPKVGTWLEEGDILVGKIKPINETPKQKYTKLFYHIIDEEIPKFKDSSFRVPKGIKARVVHTEIIEYQKSEHDKQPKRTKPVVFKEKHNRTKKQNYNNTISPSFTSDGKEETEKNSLHKSKLNLKKIQTDVGLFNNSFVENKKHTTLKKSPIFCSFSSSFSGSIKNLQKGVPNKVIFTKKIQNKISKRSPNLIGDKLKPKKVHIYLAEKRRIQVGDKMAGRHGNKGIISKIIPRQDMPYLPDGTPVDIILNPLGVPSRMNVGQIFECLLGLAGKFLGQKFKIIPFDERFGAETSRSLVYTKLYEARLKTGERWLFNPNFPGKTRIFDGRTGNCFDQPVTIGQAYMLKLIHLVDEKIHCLTGDHDVLTNKGWIPIAKIKGSHKIATLKDGHLTYSYPIRLLYYPDWSGNLYQLTTKELDLNVTLNHRMWISNGFKNNFNFKNRILGLLHNPLIFEKNVYSLKQSTNYKGWYGAEPIPTVKNLIQEGPTKLTQHNNYSIYKLREINNLIGEKIKYQKSTKWIRRYYQFQLPHCKKLLNMRAWLLLFGIWIAEGCYSTTKWLTTEWLQNKNFKFAFIGPSGPFYNKNENYLLHSKISKKSLKILAIVTKMQRKQKKKITLYSILNLLKFSYHLVGDKIIIHHRPLYLYFKTLAIIDSKNLSKSSKNNNSLFHSNGYLSSKEPVLFSKNKDKRSIYQIEDLKTNTLIVKEQKEPNSGPTKLAPHRGNISADFDRDGQLGGQLPNFITKSSMSLLHQTNYLDFGEPTQKLFKNNRFGFLNQEASTFLGNSKNLLTTLKSFPKWVWELSENQCRQLICGMVLGIQHNSYYTTSEVIADSFMRLCLHAGWSGNKHRHFSSSVRKITKMRLNHIILAMDTNPQQKIKVWYVNLNCYDFKLSKNLQVPNATITRIQNFLRLRNSNNKNNPIAYFNLLKKYSSVDSEIKQNWKKGTFQLAKTIPTNLYHDICNNVIKKNKSKFALVIDKKSHILTKNKYDSCLDFSLKIKNKDYKKKSNTLTLISKFYSFLKQKKEMVQSTNSEPIKTVPISKNIQRVLGLLVCQQNWPFHNHQKPDMSEIIYPYRGAVYCLEVPSEIFLIRRNGKAVWTGNSRSTGPYALVTQQPLRGKSKHGGQRVGEMEVWALEGFGAAYILQELLTIKSDDIKGRHQIMHSIFKDKLINLGIPESFKVLLCELNALCLNTKVRLKQAESTLMGEN